jgi:hypothetical protein
MAEEKAGSYNDSPSLKREQSRILWLILLVFLGLVASRFFYYCHLASIDWVEDYEQGIGLAAQLNKPVLLAFFKKNTRFCTDIQQNTYNNSAVKKYVEENFVPILIDVDKQPEIARRYNVSYYPTHYVRRADKDEVFGPRLGYDPPTLFISELKRLLQQMKESGN